MARLLIAGKLVVDDVLECDDPLLPGSNQRARARRIEGGGQAWHTSRAAAKAGAQVSVTGWCGDDADTDRLRADLASWGIDDHLAPLADAPRSTVLVHAGDRTIVSYGGGGHLTIDALDHGAALDDVALLHIDGFALDAVSGDALVALAHEAARRGIPITLEPPRPTKCASCATWLAALPPLHAILGRPDEIEVVSGYLTATPSITVAHDQDRPIVSREGSAEITTPVPIVEIASLGAGDRFAGGWLASRLHGADLATAAAAGIAAAGSPLS